jgi:hypothetical protein
MMNPSRACFVAAIVLSLAAPVLAQEPKSSGLAKELATALDAAKLDSIAASDPAQPDAYIAALYLPGIQLLTVSGKYAAPTLLKDKLSKKEYREIYLDLNGASIPASRLFVEDLGADGLQTKRGDSQAFDSFEAAGKRTMFDGNPGRQKLSDQEYQKTFSTAEEQYRQMLTALLTQLRSAKD